MVATATKDRVVYQQSVDRHDVRMGPPSSEPDEPIAQRSSSVSFRKNENGMAASPTDIMSAQSTSSDPSGGKPSFAKVSSSKTLHVLLAATGSVATIKIPLIIKTLRRIYGDRAEIQLIVTASAEHFLKGVKLPPDVKVWRDKEEWGSRQPGIKSDSFLHARLRRWADILLIAPLSANTLAKIANGICDNLITSVIRSWNPAIPILIAPAMNTHMYTNPMTKKHLTLIKEEFGFIETLKPVEKVLVCGDIGMGGMREWTEVVQILVKRLGGLPEEEEDDEEEKEDDEEEEEDDEEEEEDEDEEENITGESDEDDETEPELQDLTEHLSISSQHST